MNARHAWPTDPVYWRQALKKLFRALPARPLWAFLHCYVVKMGFIDGKQGVMMATGRYRYYRMISKYQVDRPHHTNPVK